MRLRVLQATGGLFTPTALPMHATLTAARVPEAQACVLENVPERSAKRISAMKSRVKVRL